jgi:hypothetical protein
VPNDGEVVGSKAGAHGGLVFAELDVEASMKPVLDFPMAAHRVGDACSLGRQGTDVVTALAARLAADVRSRSPTAKLMRSSHCSAL